MIFFLSQIGIFCALSDEGINMLRKLNKQGGETVGSPP